MTPASPDSNNRIHAWIFLPSILVLLAFAPILNLTFAFDDTTVITSEMQAHNVSEFFGKLSPVVSEDVGETTWRPMVSLTYLVFYNLFGPVPIVHHAVDWLLHALNTLLLVWLLRRLGFSRLASSLGALVFALHPLTAGTISLICFREEPLQFFLGFFALHLIYRQDRRSLRILAYLLFFFVVFVKETGSAFGLLVFFLDDLQGRERYKRLAITAGLSILAVGMLLLINRYGTSALEIAGHSHLDWNERFFVAGKAAFAYLIRLVFWRDLSPQHDDIPIPRSISADAAVGLAILAALVVLMLRAFRRPSRGAFAAALALLPLMAVLNVFLPFWIKQADRFLYVPLAGLAMAAAMGVDRVRRMPQLQLRRWRALVLLVPCALFTLFVAFLWREFPRYKSSTTLFASIVERQPGSDLGLLWLAEDHMRHKKFAEAVRLLEPLNEQHSDDLKTAGYLAECMVQLKRPEVAVKLLEGRKLIGPDSVTCALTLQAAYIHTGRLEKAWSLSRDWAFRPRIKKRFAFGFASNAAIAARVYHRLDLAVLFAQRALVIDPQNKAMRSFLDEIKSALDSPAAQTP